MKNFTNNFKQFTSRLSARWLIMALMLLVGTSSAWAATATFYFDNSVTNWSSVRLVMGHGSFSRYNQKTLTRVSGTEKLFSTSYAQWGDATQIAFHSSDNGLGSWGDENSTICHRNGYTGSTTNVTQPHTITNSSSTAWLYSVTSTTESCGSIYKLSRISSFNFTVTINSVTGGTLTVQDYDNNTVSSGASKIKLTVLKFSATPTSGYSLDKIDIKNSSGTVLKTIDAADLATSTYTLESAVTIVPTWKQDNPSYTITYKDQGNVAFSGTHASGYPTKHTYGTDTALKTASKTGYTFGGWFTKSDCSGTAVASLGATAYSADITLYAKWTANTYTITYKDKGNITFSGTHANGYPITHTYGTATTLDSPTKTGYTFGGWFTKSDCSGTAVASLGATAYSANITLYAKWTANQYNITYKDKGNVTFSGTHASGYPTKHTYGTVTTLDSPTKTGYTFGGWFTKSDCSGTAVASLGATAYSANITLYAKWTANTYTITYKDQGGTAFSGTHATGNPTTHTYGTATALKTATKSGYNFLGWFTKSDCSGTAVASLGATAYSANITLYAKWECVQSATAGEGSFSNGTITLSAKFNTCGSAYIGFQWKKQGDEWCYTNDGTEKCYKALGPKNKSNEVEETSFTTLNNNTLSGTYVFRPYIVVGNDAEDWLYGDEFTVTACITVETPNITAAPICAGSTATLTLKNKQDDVTYKLLDGTPIFTDGTTHTVKPDRTTTYTITATSENSCDAGQKETANVTVTVNAMPSVSPSVTVDMICEGKTKTIEITTNAESIQWYKDGAAIDGETSAALDITEAGTYYAIVSNASGCSNQSIDFKVANAFGSDITPTITGAASVQSGAAGITYSTANVDGALYKWQLPEGWTFSGDEDGNQITVSAPSTEGNGTITVNITKNDCTKTATLNVSWAKGYTVYLRRPHAKDETTQYNYWFEKSNAAGPGYIKFGTVKASPSDSELYTYNGGSGAETPGVLGTKGTESFTDCDGYVWDAYNIGIDVTALYFHAPNDKSTNGSTYGGHATYTRSYSQNTPISSDLYFTMGNWTGDKGRTLTDVDKPFEGIEIDALGSTEICSNNMASFAALYLKSNCTGQEITDYAWKYSTNDSSWDDYTTGKGATSNNIRPNKAGYYHLECKMKDGSVVTSNSIHITTTDCSISNEDLNNITSNLPIIMVNTGDNKNKFPSVSNGKHCSASADDLKKKRSVDVKIIWNPNGTVSSTDAYSNGANLYYDRKARMNYRGSSSLNFEKKSFAFCPGDENCGQDKDKSADYVKTKKMNMFDLSGGVKDKDWVLYAAYVDPSMMRNILAMETYSAMTGKWGVDNQYVELYIDGEYQGVYIFMDKVTQNTGDSEKQIPGRVNVEWDVKDDTKREFILKFDKTDAADRYAISSGDQKTFESDMTGKTGISTYDTEVDQRFEIEYPEKEDIEDDGGYWSDVYSFVLGKVNEFESALSKGDFTKVRDLINYESWADFFILNEFTKNVDAYRASCIFVYTGGKFEAWPLWDYELSFNNTVTGSGKGRGDINGLLIEHSDVYSDEFPAPFWWTGKYNGSNMYSGLLKDPCFLQKIKERWAEHTKAGGPLNPSTTTAKTAAYKAILDANGAATREFKKWPVTSRGKDACSQKNTGYYSYGGGGATDYATSYNQLNEWLAGDADTDPRIKGLQKEIDKFDDVIKFGISSTIDKEETTPWRAVNVTVDAVGADFTYTITPEITKGQVIEGSGNLLIYAELPQTYTVVTTLDAKDQCGANPEDNASSRVTFTVNDLVENCEE